MSSSKSSALWPCLALVAALVGAAGTLYLTLGMGLIACPLCYYQRTFVLAALGVLALGLLFAREAPVALLALPLATGGLVVAVFHSYLVYSGQLECPAGLFGLGAAPYQAAKLFLVLVVALVMAQARTPLPTLAAVVLGAGLGAACIASAPTGPPACRRPSSAEAEVRAVLEEQVAAWNAGDLPRFLDTYWDSDELTFYSGGNVMKGRKQVAERYRKNYQADGKEMGKLTFSDLVVHPEAGDRATALARWRVVTKKEAIEGLFTLELRKFADGWKIVHDHTSRADPPKKP